MEFVTVSHAEDSKGIAAWGLRADQLAHLAHRETSAALVAGIAHDLNQPLSAIGMLVCTGEDLLRKSSDPHAARVSDLLAKIDAQTTRACEMSRRLSQALRRSTPSRRACYPDVVIGRALERLAGEIRAVGADIRLRLDRSVRCGVVVDSSQMTLVVLHLVRNSIEACELSPADRRTVEICAKVMDDGNFLFEVGDTGPGLPEMQSCLFEPLCHVEARSAWPGINCQPLDRRGTRGHPLSRIVLRSGSTVRGHGARRRAGEVRNGG